MLRVRVLRPDNENLGQWNAFVADGKTTEERKLRLSSAPKRLQKDIKIHAQMVYRMRGLKK